MTSTPRQRRSSRSSVFNTLFGSGERYEVHSGCFGQYGSAWRCPKGCTLEINSEKVREAIHTPTDSASTLALLPRCRRACHRC